MTKKELAEKIAENHDLSKAKSDDIIVTVFEEISVALQNGDEITIPGFGKFTISERAARTGLNPQTKEKIQIAASKNAKFKPAKQLKDNLNK